MNRFLKIALIVLGVLVALVAIAAIVLPMVIDPNDYKGQITAAVEEKTGRELEIPGDIELTVFPWLGVQLGEVRLANAEGFGDQPFAEIGSAGVRVKLLPLLRKRIEIGTVTLTDMHLRLARKADGTTNWDDLVEAFAAEEEEPQPEEPAPEEEGFTMPDLEIEAVKIENAAVTFDDRQAGERYEISEFNLSTGRLRSGATFPVETSFVVAAEELGLTLRNKLVAQVEPDLESRFVRVPKFELEVNAKGEPLPKGEQQLALSGDGEFDAQAGRLEVSNLLLQAVGVNVAGEFSGNDLLAQPEFNGRITVKTFSPRSVMQRLGLEKIETRDSSVLSEAGLDAQFEGTVERVSFDQILIELDDSSFKGEAAVRNFDNPAITFKMGLDQMDVDRYLPPESEGEEAGEPEGGDEQAAEIDLEPLKALKLDGRLTAGKLKVANLNVEDAELAVTANNGVLRIQPLGANLYGGNLRMQSTVDAAGKRPTYAIKGDLNSLHFGPLLKDLIGTEKLEALANLTVDLTTSGTTTQEMLRSLDGSIAFDFRDGVFNGFNLPRMLEAARAQFRDKGETDVSPAGKTEFSRFAASFNVNDGVLAGRDLSLSSEKVAADGAGSYDLAANKLDYTVNTRVLEGASGKLAELEGLTVPIKLSGDLFSPRFSIDIKSALEGVARQKLQEEKQELRQKADDKIQEEKKEIEGKIQEEMKEGLNKLFGGDKKKKQQETQEEPAAETEGGGGE